MYKIFFVFRQLLVSMNERTAIICESLLCTDLWKQTLAKVLLLDFGVSVWFDEMVMDGHITPK